MNEEELKIKAKGKVHASTDGQTIPFSINFMGITHVAHFEVEALQREADRIKEEKARKEEAARFNQFRKK